MRSFRIGFCQRAGHLARNGLLASVLLLAGCSATPQIVPMTPSLAVTPSSSPGNGRTIAVEVIDVRGTEVVGYRDPTDKQSKITTAPEILSFMQRALEDGYRRLGFEIVPVGSEADIALEVRLSELGYDREPDGLMRNLETGATVEATSVLAGKTVNAIYRDAQDKTTVIAPSVHDNAEILNAHLNAALTKLVEDGRLTTE